MSADAQISPPPDAPASDADAVRDELLRSHLEGDADGLGVPRGLASALPLAFVLWGLAYLAFRSW